MFVKASQRQLRNEQPHLYFTEKHVLYICSSSMYVKHRVNPDTVIERGRF